MTLFSAPQQFRILVVEDHVDTAQTTADILGAHGYEVTICGDGRSALTAAAIQQPDAILLDLGLPGMDGYELARRFRTRSWDRRPIIFAITGRGEKNERLQLYDCGIDFHLTKPVGPEELLAFLQRIADTAKPTVPIKN